MKLVQMVQLIKKAMRVRPMPLEIMVIVFVLAPLLMLGFQNCSEVAFVDGKALAKETDASGNELGDPSDPTDATDPADPSDPKDSNNQKDPIALQPPVPIGEASDAPQVLKNCNTAYETGQLVVADHKVIFDDTKVETGRSKVCEFGVGDNLSMLDTKMRARYEQYRTLNLPENAVICDIQVAKQTQSFRYDDVFVLTYNDRVLGTNNRTAIESRLEKEDILSLKDGSKQVGLFKYSWERLRDGSFNNVADDYCIGKDQKLAECAWPVTEAAGDIILNFDPELLVSLSLKAQGNPQKFGFIITGDNDPGLDCYHEKLELAMKVSYYLKN